MRFPLNLITLALAGASGTLLAADFSVGAANTAKVPVDGYQCKSCISSDGLRGNVGVSLGVNDLDDIHAGNALGTDRDGVIGGINADVQGQGNNGYRLKAEAHRLGMANGSGSLGLGKDGRYHLNLDYRAITTYDQGDVQTALWHNDGTLVPSAEPRFLDLNLERHKASLGFELKDALFDTYVKYSREQKTGHQSASLMSPRPVNFALPVDASTDGLKAGVALKGEQWLLDVGYQGSLYRNDIQSLDLLTPQLYGVYSAAPDNEAHRLSLAGQLREDSTVMTGRVAAGRMLQDDALVPMFGNPLQNWDGQVDTLDANLAIHSTLGSRLRLGAKVDYSDRDNQSSVWDFNQGLSGLSFDALSGGFEQNLPLDIERTGVKLDASYRLGSGYRLDGGYERKDTSRSYGEREDTHDDRAWLGVKLAPLSSLSARLELGVGSRGGSDYEANGLTSSEDNTLLRKYHLADRERQDAKLALNWTATDWLSVDVNGYFARDDYDETQIGLNLSRDSGVDVNLNLHPTDSLTAYLFAGQQWIRTDMTAGRNGAVAWQADIADDFINLGGGASFSGLLDGRLTLGADYLFANSRSDGYRSLELPQPDGDYYSYQHSAGIYADYALSAQMALKLAYRYERYYDTDDARVSINGVPGLITLGESDHNYNAHQIMLTFSYLLN
ncbi:MtrB/PioB family decaheme-associated outer membrane protein [Shewanella sp. JM162201]|uniref:MtrB/PioB family decaheme-associated outer membrane protein n=1 Tax=Shewanella jiangmenensis TaxID=2837387 RepID=A0ABS5V322_9GAMM|nr:MtrB/PioB family decaheme-associated outer membrane protein [Shewanella jiangmenensis]MBT1444846.1 MtrB/PioB family decaheme-associated outer membrane protein [Shewanella jiangmenensis]